MREPRLDLVLARTRLLAYRPLVGHPQRRAYGGSVRNHGTLKVNDCLMVS
jgi:hypothetical protein